MASLQLDRAIGTLLNMAACHEKEGKTASAWNEYAEAVATASKSGQSERASYARKKVKALESRLVFVTMSPPADVVPGLEIKLNGKVLPQAAWGTELPIDPGDHRVEASAPNKVAWSDSIHVSPEKGNLSVKIPALQDLKVQVPEPAAAGLEPAPLEQPSAPGSLTQSSSAPGKVGR